MGEMQRQAHELMRALALANLLKKKPATSVSRVPKTKTLMLLADGITQVKRPLTAYNYFCRHHTTYEATTGAEMPVSLMEETTVAPVIPVPLAVLTSASAANNKATECVAAPAATIAGQDRSTGVASLTPSVNVTSSAPSRQAGRIREVSSVWSALSEEAKGPFRELAARDKLRYEQEVTMAEKVVVPAKWRWRPGGQTAHEAAAQLQTELARSERLESLVPNTAAAANADAHIIVKHHIRYDDGEQEWLRLDLERFRILGVEWSKDGVVHAQPKHKARESKTVIAASPTTAGAKRMPQRIHRNTISCAISAPDQPVEHPMREYMRAFRLARIVGSATSPP